MNQKISEVPVLIGDLYKIVQRLEHLFPDRRFTPDGHLVGSIGEVVARHIYRLDLKTSSNKGHDATTGKQDDKVQIKLTAGDRVAVAASTDYPERLIVLRLDRKKGFAEVYNGLFPAELVKRKTANTRGTITLTVNELREEKKLRKQLKNLHPLPEINSLSELNGLFVERGIR